MFPRVPRPTVLRVAMYLALGTYFLLVMGVWFKQSDWKSYAVHHPRCNHDHNVAVTPDDIAVLVVTGQGVHDQRLPLIRGPKATWNHFKQLLVVSDQATAQTDTLKTKVRVPGGETGYCKAQERYVYGFYDLVHRYPDAKYYIVADDDVIVSTSRLLHVLRYCNPNRPFEMGHDYVSRLNLFEFPIYGLQYILWTFVGGPLPPRHKTIYGGVLIFSAGAARELVQMGQLDKCLEDMAAAIAQNAYMDFVRMPIGTGCAYHQDHVFYACTVAKYVRGEAITPNDLLHFSPKTLKERHLTNVVGIHHIYDAQDWLINDLWSHASTWVPLLRTSTETQSGEDPIEAGDIELRNIIDHLTAERAKPASAVDDNAVAGLFRQLFSNLFERDYARSNN
ncbi:uncharacterized protein MONBRDRAFT_24296 [Monosiga brevicollis MX1]|uniref:Fringe-like glycosyltransferase domain-containing protein n=1 Tax=Monosiga brevicollis TaxID=81824 RepID=A9UVZ9_MONBE|nr:uncharacterized protein MONBRDRAFT_24296 [Monosiga brevicollis MX1]EDQ90476.1 predicted protein [Monosiga brevicollis MX1]|eukprot:XP_001744527.1 hypothetical protein [Monosiga brevicollis MX1]